MIATLKTSYKNVYRLICRYWSNYGGCNAVIWSPYFHIAFAISLIIFPYRYDINNLWWDLPLNILPSIVGFSLGGYAIFLAFGDEKFKKLIAWRNADKIKDETSPSPYLSFSVAFLHFIIVQLIALILAIIAKSLVLLPSSNILLNVLIISFGIASFSVFMYALFLAIAATFAIYRLVYLYDKHLQIDQ